MSWKLLPDKKIRLLSHGAVFTPEESAEIATAFTGVDMRSHGTNEFSYSYRLIEPDIWPNIYEKITSVVLDANVNNYQYKLHSIPGLYYVEFSRSQWMDWSIDVDHSARETNKLSLHIPLNEDYEDGQFLVRTPREVTASRLPGMVTIFPSFLASKQEQPSRGIKRAILGTVAGLPFS